MSLYKLTSFGVVKGTQCIPNNLGNIDWQQYQTWLASGNIPDPADAPPAPTQDTLDVNSAKADTAIMALRGLTPVQARAWVGANVTTLADAKVLLGTMAAVLCVLARRL